MTGNTSRAIPQRLALTAIALLLTQVAAAGGGVTLHNGTVAGGGQIAEAGPFRLISTIGEPSMGTTSNARFRLTSGFPATIGNQIQGGPVGGRIFQDGFED
jgi:hypothetical protein